MLDTHAVIAANRFGLGAKPGELQRIRGRHERWLLEQLDVRTAPKPIADLPPSYDVLRAVAQMRAKKRQMRKAGKRADQKDLGRLIGGHYRELVLARTVAAAASDTPFAERLVHFWSNHFAISADKREVRAVAGAIENEVVRPHLNGRFADMLVAAEQHPTMLLYLDNIRSIGPGSKRGLRAAKRQPERRLGLNENLAREILELHTLGARGGYDQADVTSLARVITGWTVGRDNKSDADRGVVGRFKFDAALHEPGAQQVLGKRYAATGVGQGEAVLRDLALHPSTAKHVAEKLARHFVVDEPPSSLVDRLARVFLASDGDLRALHTALVRAPEAWVTPLAKYKTPREFVISTMRALDHVPDKIGPVLSSYRLLGQPPHEPGSPAGWPDTAQQWRGGDALYKRIEWANLVARRLPLTVATERVAQGALGPLFSEATRKAMSRAQSTAQSLTLFLASPEFQRR
ncbi:MAG: DUF1800 family protein [Gammaproteobacteria bacterium]